MRGVGRAPRRTRVGDGLSWRTRDEQRCWRGIGTWRCVLSGVLAVLQARDVIARGEAPGNRSQMKFPACKAGTLVVHYQSIHCDRTTVRGMCRPYRAWDFVGVLPGPSARAIT